MRPPTMPKGIFKLPNESQTPGPVRSSSSTRGCLAARSHVNSGRMSGLCGDGGMRREPNLTVW